MPLRRSLISSLEILLCLVPLVAKSPSSNLRDEDVWYDCSHLRTRGDAGLGEAVLVDLPALDYSTSSEAKDRDFQV